MSRILSRNLRVPPEAIDEIGHVNNQAYLRWMQEIALAHSADLGWTLERYLEGRASWVVRSHFIEYLRPAFRDERLGAHTWVIDMETYRSRRRTLFTRPRQTAGRRGAGDDTAGRDAPGPAEEVVVRAETLWVFVDLETGRPKAVPDALRDDFPIVETSEVASTLGLSVDPWKSEPLQRP